jgi:hypothetical protein
MEHLHLFGVDIGTWQDIEAIFSMTVTLIGLIGVYFAWQQIASNANISNREKSLEAYLDFSQKYDSLSHIDHANIQRFRAGDKSLHETDVAFYFDSYWVLHLQEWQFYQAGILPTTLYVQWVQHLHEYLHVNKARRYFDDDGAPAEATFVAGYERYGLHILRFHPDFIAFICDLQAVPFVEEKRNAAKTLNTLTKLVKKHRSSGVYWKH